MATFESHAPGTPCWVDLMSPDVDASVSFYTTVFGWHAEDQFDPEGNRVYTMFSQAGRNVAGLGGQGPGMEGMPAIWNSYIATADAAATAAAVEAAGGAVVMPPMQVMDAGHMAVFSDPNGAMFSVWEAGDHVGAQVGNVHHTYSWNELSTRDVDRALAFYSSVFGWEYDPQDMGEMGTYNVIAGGESGGLGGVMAMPELVPAEVPDHWMVYFTTDDLQATLGAVTSNGGSVVADAMSAPGVGTFCVVADPAGGMFSLMQPEAQ